MDSKTICWNNADLYFKKPSLGYLLFTPSFIKNLPRPQMVGAAKYYHSCADGPKPMAEGVSFESVASKDEIMSQFDKYLIRTGYVRDPGAVDALEHQYTKGNNKFSFSIEPTKTGTNHVVAQECYF